MSGGWKCLDQPGGCPCHCHAIRAARRNSPKRSGKHWTPEQDDALREYLRRGMSVTEIVSALDEQFKIARTTRSIWCRISDLGWSTRDGWHSRRDVERFFTVNHRTITRWITQGILPAKRRVNRFGVTSRWWEIAPGDLNAFVDDYAGILFAASSVVEPSLRARAEVAARIRQRRSA